jgi:hypothetical protein
MTKNTKTVRTELDSVYLLKMVVYLLLGSFWVHFSNTAQTTQIPIPLGLIAGVFLARRERFQIDRKLEYAILLMAMFIGFWLPIGLTIYI